MYELNVSDLMEKSNEELYKLAIDIKVKLEQDINTVYEWWEKEKKKMFWNKKEPVPNLNFPDLLSEEFLGGRTYVFRKLLHDIDSELLLINSCLIDGIKIENISKSNFFDLFDVNKGSLSVCNYIIKNILEKSK